jgi:hypothetical protein
MYKIRHDLPCGEWGENHVENFCEAIQWFRCKTRGKALVKRVVTFYHNDQVVKTTCLD